MTRQFAAMRQPTLLLTRADDNNERRTLPRLACSCERSEITLILRRTALTQRTAPAKGAIFPSGKRVPTARSAYHPADLVDGAGPVPAAPATNFMGVLLDGRATAHVARPGELSISANGPSYPRSSKAIQGECPAGKPDYQTKRNA